jgi:hypothetical protein
MAGKSWGTSALSTFNSAVGVGQNFLNLYGNGYVTSGSATGSAVYITPIGTALGTGLSANITTVTGTVSAIQHQTTYGSTNTANITTARGYLAQVSLGSNSASITNAIGFHTPSGWVTAPNATGGLNITNRYAILNEDKYSSIQTSGNIVMAPAGQAITGNTATYMGLAGYTENVAYINGGANTSGQITFYYYLGTVQQLYLNGAWTLNASDLVGMYAGSSMTIIVNQSAASNTLTTSGLLWAGGNKTISITSGYVDIINIFYSGTTYYASLVLGYQ